MYQKWNICGRCPMYFQCLSHWMHLLYKTVPMKAKEEISKHTHHERFDSNPVQKPRKSFTRDEAIHIGNILNVDFDKFGIEQFRFGMDVELEHGLRDSHTNVSNDDPLITGKIALAHLKEFPDYYVRLAKMEEEAEKYWERKKEN